MRRWILKRVLLAGVTLVGITLLVFLVVHAAPGDPSRVVSSSSQDPSVDVEAYAKSFRADHLLDAPLSTQYLHFVGPFSLAPDGHRWFGGSGRVPWHGLLALDFGPEFARPDVRVGSEIARRLSITGPLALSAALLAFAIAVPLGAWCAANRGRPLEKFVAAFVFALAAAPTFWVALILVFALGPAGADVLPVVGLASTQPLDGWFARIVDVCAHALLPVLVLALASIAYVTRHARSAVLETLRLEFVRTARASGASRRVALWRHALPNALLPLATIAGSLVPSLLGGSVIVETIFGIEGLGRYAYSGMMLRDYNVILATTFVTAVFTLVGILAADIAYAFVDPRIRHG